MDEENSQENATQLLSDNLGEIEKLLTLVKLQNDVLEEIKSIAMKYYPQDKEFTNIQSALVYLLDERVDEIQNLSVKCDTLQEQLDMFQNKEV